MKIVNLLFLLICGCGQLLTSSFGIGGERLLLPNGKQGVLVNCDNLMGDCFRLARQHCGGNYKIINSGPFKTGAYLLVDCDTLPPEPAATPTPSLLLPKTIENRAKDCSQEIGDAYEDCLLKL